MTQDNGKNEMLYSEKGNYTALLNLLLNKYHDYEVLKSPVFDRKFLSNFINNYDEKSGDYSKESLIEDYLIENPNWNDGLIS